jgi:hypothetical protein
MVFGAEDAYASGNLVTLTFNDLNSTRPFEFRSVVQVKVGDTAEEPFPPSLAELVFRADAQVLPTSTVPITLGLGLTAKDRDLDISSASLTTRLFGQACKFDLRDARFESDAIVALCEGDPGDSPLQLKRIDLAWPKLAWPKVGQAADRGDRP